MATYVFTHSEQQGAETYTIYASASLYKRSGSTNTYICGFSYETVSPSFGTSGKEVSRSLSISTHILASDTDTIAGEVLSDTEESGSLYTGLIVYSPALGKGQIPSGTAKISARFGKTVGSTHYNWIHANSMTAELTFVPEGGAPTTKPYYYRTFILGG